LANLASCAAFFESREHRQVALVRPSLEAEGAAQARGDVAAGQSMLDGQSSRCRSGSTKGRSAARPQASTAGSQGFLRGASAMGHAIAAPMERLAGEIDEEATSAASQGRMRDTSGFFTSTLGRWPMRSRRASTTRRPSPSARRIPSVQFGVLAGGGGDGESGPAAEEAAQVSRARAGVRGCRRRRRELPTSSRTRMATRGPTDNLHPVFHGSVEGTPRWRHGGVDAPDNQRRAERAFGAPGAGHEGTFIAQT